MSVNNKSPRFALVFYWLVTAFLLSASLLRTGGHFVYPQDDTYIHMAIAKHLVNDGFWGVTADGFSSSTSSPLWTFLIALTYLFFGVNDYSPVALSLLSGTGIVIYCHSVLKTGLNEFRLKLFLAAAILLTPLAMLSLSGMEHLLHGLLTLGLLIHAGEYLDETNPGWRKTAVLILIAALTTSVRYEGLFVVFLISAFLFLQKRFVPSILIGAAGLLPVTAYGMYSVSQGWLFLPNSILLKGNQILLPGDAPLGIFQRLVDNILLAPHMFILMIASLWVYIWSRNLGMVSAKDSRLPLLLAMTVFLHLFFARVGWFFRYDAYLVLAGCVVAGKTASPLIDLANRSAQTRMILKTTAVTLAGVFLILPFSIRSALSHSHYPAGTKNIYEQQYQMALFIAKYYRNAVNAANDIGAINYLSDSKTIDLYGLANLEVLQERRHGTYGTDAIRALVSRENVEIVVIYKNWFKGNIPQEWAEIGTWKIIGNVACASDEVTFYAPNEASKAEAIANLREFSASLPADVVQAGEYTRH